MLGENKLSVSIFRKECTDKCLLVENQMNEEERHQKIDMSKSIEVSFPKTFVRVGKLVRLQCQQKLN